MLITGLLLIGLTGLTGLYAQQVGQLNFPAGITDDWARFDLPSGKISLDFPARITAFPPIDKTGRNVSKSEAAVAELCAFEMTCDGYAYQTAASGASQAQYVIIVQSVYQPGKASWTNLNGFQRVAH